MSELVMVTMSEEEVARFKRHTEDTKWLMRNYDRIRAQFGGEYVAILDRRVIDHDKDLIQLKKRAENASVVIQYVYKEKPHLIL